MKPSVSCLCPTFARVNLLQEAVECFLRQDYTGFRELIILNDFPSQTLRFSHPHVRVVNTSRFPSLGEKRNALATLAHTELLLTWGDDDIHLPHRISRMVDALGEGAMCLEGWHYCSYEGRFALNRFSTAGAHIVRRSTYLAVDGIPHQSIGEDMAFNARVSEKLGCPHRHATENPAFWYRWADTGRPHMSGQRCEDAEAYERMLWHAEQSVAGGTEPSGEIRLRPQWRRDYLGAVRTFHALTPVAA